MTRAEIEKRFRVVGGIIVSPGPFVLLPVYAPHFAEMLADGGADRVEDTADGPTFVFEIDTSDVEAWSELWDVKTLRLWFNDVWFVGRERHVAAAQPGVAHEPLTMPNRDS